MKWFAGVLLLLVAALAFQMGLLAYAMYVLMALLVVSRALTRSWTQNLSATRECNRLSIEVGQAVAVAVEVTNNSRFPVPWVLLEDTLHWPPSIPGAPPLVLKGKRMKISMLRPGGRTSMFYQLNFQMRGYFQLGPLVLESGDLFGLHRRYEVVTVPQFVLVYPKVAPLLGYDLASRRPIGEVRMVHRLFEDPTRITGVRLYQPGDALNRVHWRATARTAVLHSKTYEPSSIAGATVLLNFHRADFDRKFEPFRSELAVSAAASLAHAVYHMGQQVGLVTNGRDAADRIRREGWQHDHRTRRAALAAVDLNQASSRVEPLVVETRRGAEQLNRILEMLARVELSDGLTFPQLILETASRLPRDATVVAVLSEVPLETALVLGNLRRRGHAVTAIMNIYDDLDYARCAGRLLAEGVETLHLKDEAALSALCSRALLR